MGETRAHRRRSEHSSTRSIGKQSEELNLTTSKRYSFKRYSFADWRDSHSVIPKESRRHSSSSTFSPPDPF